MAFGIVFGMPFYCFWHALQTRAFIAACLSLPLPLASAATTV
jgi:hypothetical protein